MQFLNKIGKNVYLRFFGNLVVNEADNVWSNRSLEDSRQTNGGLGGLVFLRVDGDQRTSGG